MTEKDKIRETDNQMLQAKIDKYADMLFRLSLLRLQNRQDAEDVVQEAFYQYIKRTEAFQGEEHEKAWLIKVTLNACRKVWRSAWNRRRIQEQEGFNWEAASEMQGGKSRGAEERESGVDSTSQIVLHAEENRVLFQAVCALPPRYRDVIHLFYYEEMSVKEIAEITGRKESTVTSQLTRGRELLRKQLKEEYDFA